MKKIKPEQVVNFGPKKKKYKDKYQKAIEQLIYSMLTKENIILKVEKEKLIFPDELQRLIINEICYYYKKYGTISIADFCTYIRDKKELVEFLNDILVSNYQEEITSEELQEYFDVIRENAKNLEIKRLAKKLEEIPDPLEQAKISEKIRKLRIGEV